MQAPKGETDDALFSDETKKVEDLARLVQASQCRWRRSR